MNELKTSNRNENDGLEPLKSQDPVLERFMGARSEVIDQPKVYPDEVYAANNWKEYGQSFKYVTATAYPYPSYIGKSITGLYSGNTFSTIVGDFQVPVGVRGFFQGVMVFSETGIGHLYKAAS